MQTLLKDQNTRVRLKSLGLKSRGELKVILQKFN